MESSSERVQKFRLTWIEAKSQGFIQRSYKSSYSNKYLKFVLFPHFDPIMEYLK